MDWKGSQWTFGGVRVNFNINVQKKYGTRFYKFLTILSLFTASLVFLYKLAESEE